MPRHLTVRMAWHDNNWNGSICADPEGNVYCVGEHSLLSERIKKNRNLEIEKNKPNTPIGKIPGYIPPCFWSTNAFSKLTQRIVHKHPFPQLEKDVKPIRDQLPAYSVFTWPFRLSFNHSKKKFEEEGKYPKKLKERISRFIGKFTPNKSFVFFYLNYDNPISAEERYYVLVGCALLSRIDPPKRYRIDPKKLDEIRKKGEMKNFSDLNWALRVTYDFEKSGILLPYKDYLEHARNSENWREKLDRMRVLIEEDELIPSFKYVANELNDDQCIYLLYKLKKAIKIVQEDDLVDFSRKEKLIEKFLKKAWANRGLYPSLGRVLDIIGGFEGETLGKGTEIVEAIKRNLKNGEDLLDVTFKILKSSKIPVYLNSLSGWVNEIRKNLKDHQKDNLELLKKLSLFTLTHRQIKRILYEREEAFKTKVSAAQVASNPYLLAEEYVPAVSDEDLDKEEIPDGPIGLFTIDIGMHPDPKYIQGNPRLHNLSPAGKERIRALMIDYLYQRGNDGDCYVDLDEIYEYIRDYPLFYKSENNLPKEKLENMSDEFRKHLTERITIKENDSGIYFYLNEVKEAEEIVRKTVTALLESSDYEEEISNLKEYLEAEADELAKKINGFDKQLFMEERSNLFSNVLRKHFYIISGKPGSGKTQAIGKIVKELRERGEDVTLLAPTGKATLRLQEEVKNYGLEPKTIDRFIYSTDYYKCLESFESFLHMKHAQPVPIQNLIIDECSMVDLKRLAVLFKMLWRNGTKDRETLKIKRVILVGDENQLPPIGFGRPFHDIIDWIKQDKRYRLNNYIRLRSNCRHGFDPEILRIAEIYETKNRYYEEKLEELRRGGEISKGLSVELWKTPDELKQAITRRLDELIAEYLQDNNISDEKRFEGLNIIYGLYPTGCVKNNDPKTMRLEDFQILSPYRGEYFGTLGLNNYIKATYRQGQNIRTNSLRLFDHADKIIRTENMYDRNRKTLKLSNGSIGLYLKGKYYFRELISPIEREDVDDGENFELAYAITVHKAQGSEFKHVFMVLPRKRALLTKELLYTALTRSTETLVLFLEESEEENPLQLARERSATLSRNTSIFAEPEDIKGKLWPDKKVPVKSKIEYILYKYLDQAKKEGRLEFKYEEALFLENKGVTIHPDFTIWVDDRKYYWEHLGELDVEIYSKNWAERRRDYEENGLIDFLITTDDLEGLRDDLILRVIDDIVRGQLKDTPESKFSKHHYQLY